MNSSTAPANNENVAYGHVLAQTSKLKRVDQVNLVRALAGQLGMIALFPAQLGNSPAVGSGAAKAAKGPKKKGPAKQEPSNPLSGSPEKKAFDAAKKAVAKATKDNAGQKLEAQSPLVVALEGAKDKYFRALSNAKGTSDKVPKGPYHEDPGSSSEDEPESSSWAESRPKGTAPPAKPAEPKKPIPAKGSSPKGATK